MATPAERVRQLILSGDNAMKTRGDAAAARRSEASLRQALRLATEHDLDARTVEIIEGRLASLAHQARAEPLGD